MSLVNARQDWDGSFTDYNHYTATITVPSVPNFPFNSGSKTRYMVILPENLFVDMSHTISIAGLTRGYTYPPASNYYFIDPITPTSTFPAPLYPYLIEFNSAQAGSSYSLDCYLVGSPLIRETIDWINKETPLSTDTTITSSGKYKATENINITIPASLEIGEIIEIYAESTCRVYQSDSESIITHKSGLTTSKGVTTFVGTNGASGNGYLMLPKGCKVILTYKGVGKYLTDTATLIGNIGNTALGVKSKWSHDGRYLVTTNRTTSPYAMFFKRTGDSLSSLGAIPSVGTDVIDAEWSPDDNYLVLACEPANPAKLYSKSGDTLSYIGTVSSASQSTTWSKDMTYLAIAQQSSGGQWYKRSGNTLTVVAGGIPSMTCQSQKLVWSPDGDILAGVGTASVWGQYWKRNGDSLSLIGTIPGIITATCNFCAWSPNGKYFVLVSPSSSPYIQMYKRVADTLVFLTNPPSIMTQPFHCSWSPDSKYFAVAGNASPWAQWWKMIGDSPVYLGALPSVTANTNDGIEFSGDGNYISSMCNASPYGQWWKIYSSANKSYDVEIIDVLYPESDLITIFK